MNGGDENMKQAFLTEYISYNGISDSRAASIRRELDKFEAFIPVPLTDVDEQHFRDYLLSLAGLHPNTIQFRRNLLRPFFKWAMKRRHIDTDRGMRLLDVESPYGVNGNGDPKPYTRKELAQFWLELDGAYPLDEDRFNAFIATRMRNGKHWSGQYKRAWRHATRLQLEAIVALALYVGLRRREIFHADIDDIHYDNEYVVVRHAKGHHALRRQREVPYTAQAVGKVEAWIEARTLLMRAMPPTSEHDRPWLSLSPRSLHHPTDPLPWARFEKMLGKIGAGWELHRFRHTFGTEWLRTEKVTLEQVSRAMGHASIQMTLRYAQILRDDIRKSMSAGADAFDAAVSGGGP